MPHGIPDSRHAARRVRQEVESLQPQVIGKHSEVGGDRLYVVSLLRANHLGEAVAAHIGRYDTVPGPNETIHDSREHPVEMAEPAPENWTER